MISTAVWIDSNRLEAFHIDLLGSASSNLDCFRGKIGYEAQVSLEDGVKAILNGFGLLCGFVKASLYDQIDEFINSFLGDLAILTTFTELDFITV